MKHIHICEHCGEPITHSTNKLTKYCNRPECIKSRSTDSVKSFRAKHGLSVYRCDLCGRKVNFPTGTPRGKRICKRCREDECKTKEETKMCDCCHIRPVYPGFRKLCLECWQTDGNYDAEKQRRDSLDMRFW